MARNIKVIPSTVPLHAVGPVVTGAKRRVAAYARVSTDRDEQFTSYEAQIDYYTNYIKSRPDWEFVSVYSDEGKTGCNTRKREGFKNMVDDALDGKIDLIVTKSVSRFARNTVDSLTTIRKLKDEEGELEQFAEADMLILDDLGVEGHTPYVIGTLTDLMDRRIRMGKPMLFSTNLNLDGIQKAYDERIVSRLLGHFVYCYFYGEDLRIKAFKEGK